MGLKGCTMTVYCVSSASKTDVETEKNKEKIITMKKFAALRRLLFYY